MTAVDTVAAVNGQGTYRPAGPSRSISALGLDPARHRPHALHATEATWSEINCSVDLWIEVLHALGHEPAAAGAFTLSASFEGDQWSFLKYPVEDLRELFGVQVDEINVWRPLPDHACEQLARGRLLTVEVDAFWLPDVAGTDYRTNHTKTTIGVEAIDVAGRTARYFHGRGFWRLEGEDFDGVFGWEPWSDRLAPYVERAVFGSPASLDARRVARDQLRRHLAARPPGNPVAALGERLIQDLGWLGSLGLNGFHAYAFGGLRQCGAGGSLAAALLEWLAPEDLSLAAAAADFRRLSEAAKSLQFSLARVARGRAVDVTAGVASMITAWQAGIDKLDAWQASTDRLNGRERWL